MQHLKMRFNPSFGGSYNSNKFFIISLSFIVDSFNPSFGGSYNSNQDWLNFPPLFRMSFNPSFGGSYNSNHFPPIQDKYHSEFQSFVWWKLQLKYSELTSRQCEKVFQSFVWWKLQLKWLHFGCYRGKTFCFNPSFGGSYNSNVITGYGYHFGIFVSILRLVEVTTQIRLSL